MEVNDIQEKDLVIDIRRFEEYEVSVGELAFPFPEVLDEDLPMDRRIVFVCRSGNRSLIAAKSFCERGYQACSLKGGVIQNFS